MAHLYFIISGHHLLFIWTKCQHAQFLEICEWLWSLMFKQHPLNLRSMYALFLTDIFFWVIFVFLIRVDLHDFKLEINPRSGWQEFESVILDKLIWFLLIFGKLNMNLNPASKITLTKSKHKPDPWTSTTKYSTQNFLLMLFSWHLFLGSFYFFHSSYIFILYHSP